MNLVSSHRSFVSVGSTISISEIVLVLSTPGLTNSVITRSFISFDLFGTGATDQFTEMIRNSAAPFEIVSVATKESPFGRM
jgi:hypothetical protein